MAKLEIENTQDSTATGVVVQCPYSAWWVIGWHRAAIWRLQDKDMEMTEPRLVKARKRHAAAISRCRNLTRNVEVCRVFIDESQRLCSQIVTGEREMYLEKRYGEWCLPRITPPLPPNA